MTTCDAFIIKALAPYTACRPVDGGTLVTTQCLYPGGDGVSVLVGQGADGYSVSDDGAGWQALLAAGMEVSPSTHGKRARSIAATMGVEFRRGSFIADAIGDAQLGAAIVIVANASQRWVTDILSERQRRVERDLRRLVADQLARLFTRDRISTHRQLSGATSKTYEFANIVALPNRLLIVEPVANHAGAIAASFLKLTDVHNAHPDFPREVVIEDQDSWKSEDLAVLSEASDGIRDIARGLEPLRAKYPEAA
ncbi:MAG: hypothetical protein KF815_07660 [Rhodospirillales bacterium]|nr:hypothetical protein [Rhodospirillales bacterium]MDG4601228.1 hypothetical protein [Defluviicoccus sp.]MDG4609184.1 hypothetical protein [Defluviicoccus sp.]